MVGWGANCCTQIITPSPFQVKCTVPHLNLVNSNVQLNIPYSFKRDFSYIHYIDICDECDC